MQERSDEALMNAYAKGSMAAFETLYQRHRGPLYRYIQRLAGDAATANDLFQGAWEKVIKARKSYRASAPFKAWLYRIAHNHVIDHFRRSRPISDRDTDTLAAPSSGPVQLAEAQARSEALTIAIAALPDEQKTTLLLKLESGLDLATIASITGVNRETAKSRIRYALDKLKRTLRE